MAARNLVPLVLLVASLPAPSCAQSATLVRFDTAAPMGDRRPPDPFALHDVGIASRPQAAPGVAAPIRTTCADAGLVPPSAPVSVAGRRRLIYWSLIRSSECEAGLPAGLMDSLVHAESGYDPTVVSPAGAAGLAQLMPATADALGVANRFDPEASVRAGARYLRGLLDQFEGDVPLALAAYNAGPGAVQHARGIPLNGETPGYVARVIRYWRAPGAERQDVAVSARQLAASLGFAPPG